MSYAEVTHVQALIPEFPIGSSSQPSTSEVATMITQVEGEINGVLSAQGYSAIPATGTNDVALLQGYTARKVAALVLLAAYGAKDAADKAKLWLDEYDKFIARLRRGEQHLIDQLPQGEMEPLFGIVRTPTRDAYFTERGDEVDWDE